MLVFFDAATGDITHTMHLQEGYQPPAGDFIEVEDIDVDPLHFHVVDGFLEQREVPTDAQRAAAQEAIQTVRGDLRRRFITDLPGQDMVYLEKRSEAVAFLSDPDPAPLLFPMVFAEVGITADTPDGVAQVWLNMSDIWRNVSTVIEAATLRASRLVEEAATTAQLDAALAQMQADLVALVPG
ncbi:hypothetical protein [Pseudogemmobacter faecipullorum]|uniref:DUF4376 domain-containing protein n=1 Tax=Pseudogemmobacter faecipullorum TaxID=2755041 RepID=A0ABS8CS15_9RHOB|nr:hypothetical protein [Pseudogemmobacter faecipullorum]MCB5412186.1 hypothetical protein [Pseudogemmobacter faecipullorum]